MKIRLKAIFSHLKILRKLKEKEDKYKDSNKLRFFR